MLARTTILSAAVAGLAAGCHTREGGWFPYTGGSSTYYSSEDQPTTITLVDTRTSEPIFTIEIPVGKQLSLDFKEGEGDDSVQTPDLMRYQLFDQGTQVGALTNGLSVPNAACRRLDVDYRPAPERAAAPPEEPLRIDRAEDRPAWWTPEGGPIPRHEAGTTLYDG